MPAIARRVAVIGAGPAGAIATDALLKEQAFDVVRVFDRRDQIGGTWVYTPHLPAKIPSLKDLINGNADVAVPIPENLPTETPKTEAVNSHQVRFSDTALHENLHSNIHPSIMSYTQEPFQDTLSEYTLTNYGPGAPFRHHEQIRDWVESIFTHGGHEKLLELGTTVELAEKKGNEWVLTLRKERLGKNYWWQEKFEGLVVSTGHYNVPWFPNTPGLIEYDDQFPGRILHSKHFRGAEKFRGKRVVIVGASVSSHEILHEILPIVQHPVFASIRGEPIPAFGWAPFKHPHVVVKKDITRLDPATGRIFFADNTSLDDVDHIVYGTGYTFSLPWLPHVQERIRKAYRRLPGVYQHTWDIEDPTLTFVGMLGGGFTFRVYEWQAVAVARHLAGRARPLPPTTEQKAWEKDRAERLVGGKAYYSIAPDYETFFELLRFIAGDPVPGTSGRTLPPFDKKWLDIWAAMTVPKIKRWEWLNKRAEEEEGRTKARL
ncbi:hypothetical protein F4810DRAFT_716694 [Camillea tinctor]|nr:hypothetical protein F4810DRAFT_716694 [Camillea tinctor]